MQKGKKMKDENKKSTKESFEQIDAEKNVSRRNFIKGTTGAIAAGSAIGLMGTASKVNAAVAPPEPDSPDTSVRWKTNPGISTTRSLVMATKT